MCIIEELKAANILWKCKKGLLSPNFYVASGSFFTGKKLVIILNIRNAEASILPCDKSVNTLNFLLSRKIKIPLIY